MNCATVVKDVLLRNGIRCLAAAVGGGLAFLPIDQSQIRAAGPDADWTVVFEDDFDRDFLGVNWIEHYEVSQVRDKQLSWHFRANVYCRRPLPRDDVRVEFDFTMPGGEAIFYLRSGESFFSGGGIDDGYRIRLVARENTPAAHEVCDFVGLEHYHNVDIGQFQVPDWGTAEPASTIAIPAAGRLRVALQIRAGEGSVEIDGETFLRRRAPRATSEFNRYFAVRGMPRRGRTTIENVRILAGASSSAMIPLRYNTPQENRAATVVMDEIPEPENAGFHIQKAIDSLPGTGGAVLLPEGAFTVRRHLEIPSNVALRGRGARKTVLRIAAVKEAGVIGLQRSGDESVIALKENVESAGFRVVDGVSLDTGFGYPVRRISRGPHVVTGMDGNRLRIRHGTDFWNAGVPIHPAYGAPQPGRQPDTIRNFTPMLYASAAEFPDVADMRILDDADHNVWGGQDINPVSFFNVGGARIARLQIGPWRGDGVSYQSGNDTIVVDNTVVGTYFGFHPGGGQTRNVFARNFSAEHHMGMYFCYYVQNGVFLNSRLGGFHGYAWPHCSFNIVGFNECPDKTSIEGHWWGIVYRNRFGELAIGDNPRHRGEGPRNVHLGRFVVADNEWTALTAPEFSEDSRIDNLLFASNRQAGGESAIEPLAFDDSIFLAETDVPAPPPGLEPGCGRNEPVAPPAFPEPVLDGRDFYDPGSPDAGFQAALEELRASGGTLLLPGGRYPLQEPLRPGSGVVVAGRGAGTVLCPAPGKSDNPLIVVEGVKRVTIRDLSVLSEYGEEAKRPAAILFRDAEGETIAVDIRGWEGDGIRGKNSVVKISDSRAFACAGTGFVFEDSSFDVRTSLARGCDRGFQAIRPRGASLMYGLIAGLNVGEGFLVEDVSNGLNIICCNASQNGFEGFKVASSRGVVMLASVAVANSLADPGTFAGVKLENCRESVLGYCLMGDEHSQTAQRTAILEDSASGGNRIAANIAARRRGRDTGKDPIVVSEGAGSVAENNIDR